uniref:glycosyltransferase family 2 protein n=1 Tax=Alistipes megaguti TaxID=2364787 RepID=UPI000EFD2BF7|nr:glycosyltransferase family 2 protein [Alistipes megaguti]
MKISIITATYNSGQTLTDTLESVLRQSYTDIDYVIVDGGSKDNTLDIIRRYEPRFEGRMRWISEPDKGIYDAMNKGIRMATGDVVGLLNSDDFYTSNDVLEHVARALSDPNVDAIYGDIHYVNDDDLTHCVRYYSSRVFSRGLMRLGFMPAHPSFYCRRAIYERYGTFDISLRIAADFENLLRLIFVNRIRTKYIPVDFVTMRTGGASSSGMVSHKRILKEHMIAYKQNGVYSNLLLEGLRYLYKIGEIIVSKFSRC